MLQRIQSIWLLIAAVCSFLTLKFEFYAGEGAPALTTQSSIFYTILAVGIGIASFITIFLFKQRKIQIRIILISFLLSAALLTLLFLQLKKFTSGTISLWSIFYFAIPVMLLLALRGVLKDEKLVKSMDKLR